MLNLTSLRFARTPDLMRAACKRDFESTCLVTGLRRSELAHMGPLESAHIFGSSNWPELARCVENGIPLAHYWHVGGPHSLDAIPSTNMPARFMWLADHIHEDFRGLVRVRMEKLLREISPYSPRIAGMADELYEILARLS